MMQRSDGQFCSSPEESLQLVVDTHFPGNTIYSETTTPSVPICWDLQTEAAAFITPEKVIEAAKSFGDFKAAGPDGIQPCVLKHLGTLAAMRLSNMFKASYLLGYVPKCWLKSRVIFIPKPGKNNYNQPRSFRPISLSSSL